MKFLSILAVAVGLAAGAPVSPDSQLDARQVITIRNELESGSSARCPRVIFIFARASVEGGNMVRSRSFRSR